MSISGLYMENIRCFRGKHYVPLKPLTILVGENSTGKTTILGTISALSNYFDFGIGEIDFNNPPFLFGRFENFVSSDNKQSGRIDYFSVGFTESTKSNEEYIARFSNDDGQPNLAYLMIANLQELVYFDIHEDGHVSGIYSNQFENDDNEKLDVLDLCINDEIVFSDADKLEMKLELFGHQVISELNYHYRRMRKKANRSIPNYIPSDGFSKIRRAYSIAPIRALPETTYESYKERRTPQGHHVPFVLERHDRKGDATELFDAINGFGEASGLYSTVGFTRFGEPEGSRFELTIEIAESARNFAFVGVGVAQVLPVLTDAILAPANSLITVQQPEVHLHPRAQAELGTLFVNLVKHQKKQIIVETHSDYILDRVRQEIGNGTIDSDDVQILFTELDGSDAIIHEIGLNERGEMIEQPDSYRRFFMEEAMGLLKKGR